MAKKYMTVTGASKRVDPAIDRETVRAIDATFHLTPATEDADPAMSRPGMPHSAAFTVPDLPDDDLADL